MDNKNVNLVQGILILVLVLSAFIAGKRHREAPFLKYSFYWLVIFFVAALVYSYKDAFTTVKDRVLANLYPGYIAQKHGELTVKKDRYGHFYVLAKVNGISLKFMVDTGSSSVVLPFELAQKIGIEEKSLKFMHTSYTANGPVKSAKFIAENFEVGPVMLHNFPISVIKGDFDTPLLGMSFLNTLDYFKFDNDILILGF